ncbi:7419_t:CDS:1, partial [Dentiscutata heterogama]
RISTAPNLTLSSNIYILDLKNNIWVTALNLNKPTASPTASISGNPTGLTQETSPQLPGLFIEIGIGLGGLILVGLLVFIGFKIYRRPQKYVQTSDTAI